MPDNNTETSQAEQVFPEIRRASIEVINLYEISEEELERFASGDPASLNLNFALALIPFSLGILSTLLTTQIKSNRVFEAYVIVCAISGIIGVIQLVQWLTHRGTTGKLADAIRKRMPLPKGSLEKTPRSD